MRIILCKLHSCGYIYCFLYIFYVFHWLSYFHLEVRCLLATLQLPLLYRKSPSSLGISLVFTFGSHGSFCNSPSYVHARVQIEVWSGLLGALDLVHLICISVLVYIFQVHSTMDFTDFSSMDFGFNGHSTPSEKQTWPFKKSPVWKICPPVTSLLTFRSCYKVWCLCLFLAYFSILTVKCPQD